LALEIFHSFGGMMLAFGGTLLLLLIADKILKTKLLQTNKPKTVHSLQSNKDSTSAGNAPKRTQSAKKIDIIKVLALSLTVILLLSIQTPVFALTTSPAEIIINTPTGQQTSAKILPELQNYSLQFFERDTDFEETAKIDMALSLVYLSQNTTQTNLWVSIEIASTLSNLHRWETCIIDYPLRQGSRPVYEEITREDIQVGQNPPIITRYFAFKDNIKNQTQAVIYWYETAACRDNTTIQLKNAKISVIAFPDKAEDLPQIKPKLEKLTQLIVSYWQPIQAWSPVSLTISQNGAQIAEAATIPLLVLTFWCVYQERKQKQTNKKAYQKLSDTNKHIINAINSIKKPNSATLENISDAFNKTNKIAIDQETFRYNLTALEKAGLVKQHITNEQDEPTQTWKT
jgi:hypothetical protein